MQRSERYALNRLLNQHRYVDAFINKEQRRPNPDAALLHNLKKKRLRLKDAARRLQSELCRAENIRAPRTAS